MTEKCSSGLLLLKWLQWFQPPLPEHEAHIQKPSIQGRVALHLSQAGSSLEISDLDVQIHSQPGLFMFKFLSV